MTTTLLSPRQHVYFWIGAIISFIGFVWIFSPILLPFVLGIAIAYLLNPLMNFLAGLKVPRTAAALLILGLFLACVIILAALAVPPLHREMLALAAAIPGYIDRAMATLAPYLEWAQTRLGEGDFAGLEQALRDNIGKAASIGAGVLGGIASGGQAVAGFLSVVVLTPIVAFFMMREWATMTKWIDNLLPRGSYKDIRELLRQIDRKLAGFVRGQISIAFILAVVYALALTIAGLQFGFLIGIISGILSIIPLVGSTVGLLAGVLVAWLQTGEWSYVAVIAAIFLIGQFIEGNFLTPRLLGESVGLHPLWILFALLAGGSLFGILGMLLAVPVAAVVGVLAGFGLRQYRKSPLYQAQDTSEPASAAGEKSARPRKKRKARINNPQP